MAEASEAREVLFDNLRSGLATENLLEDDPPALRVSWIAWDSGFRGSGLQVGDQIVAVEGASLDRPSELPQLQKMLRELPGGLNESDVYIANGLKDGSPLRLKVRRRRYPGEGWVTHDIAGTVRAERAYSLANGRRGMGPTGPDALANDGFEGSWLSWYERRVFDWTRVLDGGWSRTRLDTRRALQEHMDEKPRIDLLCERYPGPFADAVRSDFDAVLSSLEGTRYTLDDGALDFRQLGEERAQQVAAAAADAWRALLAVHAAEIVPAFPSVDPFRGDRSDLVGKLVVLDRIGPRDWVAGVDRNFLSSTRDGFWYFAAADSPPMRRLWIAMQRYRRHVSPQLDETFAVVGRILPDPRMMVVERRGVAGLEVDPVAVLAGGAMFVDLTVVRGDESPFAGEDSVQKLSAGLPPNDATPKQVLEGLIAALKAGEEDVWNSLYADWRFLPDEQQPLYYPYYPYPRGSRDEDWIRSRRLMHEQVCDVRVVWIGETRLLARGDEYEGAPRIEQVDAELEHIGHFAGEYRAFNAINVHRLWRLQRRNDGPWRISSHQGV
jgi:hypothetical protein